MDSLCVGALPTEANVESGTSHSKMEPLLTYVTVETCILTRSASWSCWTYFLNLQWAAPRPSEESRPEFGFDVSHCCRALLLLRVGNRGGGGKVDGLRSRWPGVGMSFGCSPPRNTTLTIDLEQSRYRCVHSTACVQRLFVQGYLAHKNPPPLGLP